jgi:hypothetical protein
MPVLERGPGRNLGSSIDVEEKRATLPQEASIP